MDRAAVVITVALLGLVALGVTGPPRLALALAFVTFVPGWALLGHSGLGHGVARIALAVAASLTICTAAALAMAWLDSWQPFAVLYGLGFAGLAVLRWRSARGPRRLPTVVRPEEIPLVSPAPDAQPAPDVPPAAEVLPAPEIEPRPVEQRRFTVSPNSLRLTHVAVRVVSLPRPPFGPSELTDFFAAVHDRHPFADFHRESDDGATMETRGAQRLQIRRDGVEYAEASPIDFEHARHNAVELLREVQSRLGVHMLANPSCQLRATLGSNADGGFPSSVLARAAGIDLGHTSLLSDTGPVQMGVRFTGQSDDPRHTWHAVLEPEGRAGQVSIEVTTDFWLAAEGPDAVGAYMRRSHRFLTDHVIRFVEALVESTTDEP